VAAQASGKAVLAPQTPRIGEWQEAEGRLELLAARCTACGETFFPARKRCLRCRGLALERTALRGPARLTNFTVIHQAPAGFTSPLVAGYAEFEPGVSVFAPIDGNAEDLEAGKTLLDVYAGPIKSQPNGEPFIAYRYRRAGSTES
jgi:uncharacterized OB-fold protein